MATGFAIEITPGDTVQLPTEKVKEILRLRPDLADKVFAYDYEEEDAGPSPKAEQFRQDAIKLIQRQADLSIVPVLANTREDIQKLIDKEVSKGYDPSNLASSMQPEKIRQLNQAMKLRDAYDQVQAVSTDEDVDNALKEYRSNPNPYLADAIKKIAYKATNPEFTLAPEMKDREGRGLTNQAWGATKDFLNIPGRALRAGESYLSNYFGGSPYLTPSEEFSMPAKYKSLGEEAFDALLAPVPYSLAGKTALRGLRAAAPIGAALRGGEVGNVTSILSGVPKLADAARGSMLASEAPALARVATPILKEAPMIGAETMYEYTRPESEGGGVAPALATLIGGAAGAGLGAFGPVRVADEDALVKKYASIYGKPMDFNKIGHDFYNAQGALKSAQETQNSKMWNAYVRDFQRTPGESVNYLAGVGIRDLASDPKMPPNLFGDVLSLDTKPKGYYSFLKEDYPAADAALRKVTGRGGNPPIGVDQATDASIDDLIRAIGMLPDGPDKQELQDIFELSTRGRGFEINNGSGYIDFHDVPGGEFAFRRKRAYDYGRASQFAENMLDPIERSAMIEKASVRDPGYLAGQQNYNRMAESVVGGFKNYDIVPEAVLARIASSKDISKDLKRKISVEGLSGITWEGLKKLAGGSWGVVKKVAGRVTSPDVIISAPSAAVGTGLRSSQKQSETERRWQEYVKEAEKKRFPLAGNQ